MNFKILHEFPAADVEQPWREFLSRVEMPSHYDAPEYFLDPLRRGSQPFAVLAFDEDQIKGVLTGFHVDAEVFCGLSSRPQICIEGSNIDRSLECLALGLRQEARRAELVHIFAWSSMDLSPFSAMGFRRHPMKGSVVLDLTRGPEALFRDFAKDRRRNIRFAEKHGVDVREADSPQDIAAAHAVYSAWRRTDRKNVQGDWSFSDFEKTMSLRNNRRLFLATFRGQVIAINIFRFFPGGLFESAANSSLPEFMYLKPNDLLQWRGIQWACSHGLRRHSLGGAHEFLARFGGTVVPIIHYRLDRTLFHRHDVKNRISESARSLLEHAPPSLGRAVRKFLKKKA